MIRSRINSSVIPPSPHKNDSDSILDYVKEPIKNDAEKMAVQFELKKFRQENGSGSLRAVVIDTEEIVEKLGLR